MVWLSAVIKDLNAVLISNNFSNKTKVFGDKISTRKEKWLRWVRFSFLSSEQSWHCRELGMENYGVFSPGSCQGFPPLSPE